MLGAIIGDTVGSVYEFNNIKTTQFPLFSPESIYTDDSIMTVAIARWLLEDSTLSPYKLTDTVLWYAQQYPCPMGGYGGGFRRWLMEPAIAYVERPQADGTTCTVMKEIRKPYNSWGNGSAMRTSAVGWMFDTLGETLRVAELQAAITHNHPEGIKGAQATAAAIFMARNGSSKPAIRQYIQTTFGYDLSKSCDDIRPTYTFGESCQDTVPQALAAFLDSTDFESCLRLAVSLGGDSDTLACIAAGIAEAYYRAIPSPIVAAMWQRLPDDFKEVIRLLHSKSSYRVVEYIP